MRLIFTYLKKLFVSPITYMCISAVAIIFLYASYSNGNQGYAVNALNVMLGISPYRKIVILFSALPFVTRFSKEYNNRTVNSIIIRSSAIDYLFSHIVVCFISAFLVTAIGLLLYFGILTIKYPVYIDTNNPASGAFYSLTEHGAHIGLYIFFEILHYSISLASWTLSGLAMSALFPSTFIALSAPLIFSYIIEMVSIESSVLPDLWHLSLGYTDVSENCWIASGYIIFVFLVLSALFSIVFWIIAHRRIQDETN